MTSKSKREIVCAVGGCKAENVSLHGLPSEQTLRLIWLKFIFNNQVPEKFSQYLRICTAHFSSDCIAHQDRYTSGFAKSLILQQGSVPSILHPAAATNQVVSV